MDFLFPAPFSRRQILLYKILGGVSAAVFVALLMATSLIRGVRSWPAAAVGFFLAWLIINALTMCAQLIAQGVGERAFTRARRLLLGALIAAAAAALGQAASRGLGGPWEETLWQARHSAVAEAVLAPFAVFAEIVAADRLIPDALGWVALGAAMVVGTYALAVRLDADYLEAAVRVSRKIQERRRRAMSGGVFASESKGTVRSSRLPQPPWLGGAGPLVWRQVIQILRGGRRAVLLAVVIVVAVGTPMVLSASRVGDLSRILPHVVIGVSAYVTFLFSAQTAFGFRGDCGRMDFLKSLPITPVAMASGQMAAAVILLALIQWLVFAVTAVFVPAAAAEMLIAGLFAVPFDWVLLGTESLLFLLYPSPPAAAGSEGFLQMGRAMLSFLVKLLVLGACCAVAVVPAAVVHYVTGSLLAALVAAWSALFLPAAGILLLVAWAFQRYDVSDGTSE